MDRVTAKLRRFSKIEEDNGFKFAVTLIVAFSTIAYRIYDYVENNPVSDFWYELLSVFIPIFLTVLGLILYIVIKGTSLEIENPESKEKLKSISSSIYISTFKWFFVYIISMPLIHICLLLGGKVISYTNDRILVYVAIFLYIFILGYSILKVLQVKSYLERGSFWKNILNTHKIIDLRYNKFGLKGDPDLFITSYIYSLFAIEFSFIGIFMIFFSEITGMGRSYAFFLRVIKYLLIILLIIPLRYIWRKIEKSIFIECFDTNQKGSKADSYLGLIFFVVLLSGSYITPHILTGNIRVEMDENYLEKNNQIPIEIVNTGYNENVTVNLSKTTFEGNFSILDSLEIHPTKNINEVVSSKYLRSSTLDYGLYKIYVNTTNLTQGYYELSVSEDPKNELMFPVVKKTFSSFYLDKT